MPEMDSSSSSVGGGGGGEYNRSPGFLSSSSVSGSGSHEDLKEMLDGNKDHLKLEAMKRIIGMIARGKDASELFPPVVKNVVTRNVEVKKLVYVYLERYAEEQQDLALLCVSTFQKALKDPNQLIRASALRVLSSIRVPVIAPIMLLAIKDATGDMSPFVRKAAANAIPKLYSLDPDTLEELVGQIEKLLADRTTLVAGSSIYAFEQLCPERTELIHRNYRRLCSLLVDVDEWGQVIIANMLLRYARSQFLDPNQGESGEEESSKPKSDNPDEFFSDEESEEDESESESVTSSKSDKKSKVMDPDHRLLLKNSKPLLQSRNSAVVMAVCQLYYYLAPRNEVSIIVKPMIRLLRSHREIQAIMLNTIETFSRTHKSMFEPYLKSFYIRASDPTHVKLLKLEILTNLASQSSIGVILKEFQAYVHSSDPKFVAATIHAIGRCASCIPEVADQCLSGLMGLMASRNEIVVAESVVTTKKLLQQKPDDNLAIIIHMAKMIDKITIPMARASILWMIGENCDKVQKYAPDVLRKMAKSFPNEEEVVKLQVVNLAAKLYLTNPKQVRLLVQYVLNLAKYDENYDIRDRARLIRNLVLPATGAQGGGKNNITKHAKKILFSTKPAPVLSSAFRTRNEFTINSLSHYLNKKCTGYRELPDFPTEKPDPSVRNVEPPAPEPAKPPPVQKLRGASVSSAASDKKIKKAKKDAFYSDDDEDEDEEDQVDEDSEEEEDEDESEEESEDSDDEEDVKKSPVKKAAVPSPKKKPPPKEETSEEEEEESEEESSSDEEPAPKTAAAKPNAAKHKPAAAVKPVPPPARTDSEESEEESSEEEDSSEEEAPKKPAKKTPPAVSPKKKPDAKKTEAELAAPLVEEASLLDFDAPDVSPASPVSPIAAGSRNGGMLLPQASMDAAGHDASAPPPSKSSGGDGLEELASGPVVRPEVEVELLNRLIGRGLSVSARFTRTPFIYNQHMLSVELVFRNSATDDAVITNIHVEKLADKARSSFGGVDIYEFPVIPQLNPSQMQNAYIGVDYSDTLQPAQFTICCNICDEAQRFKLQLNASVGELIRPCTTSEGNFNKLRSQLTGMNVQDTELEVPETLSSALVTKCVCTVANLGPVTSEGQRRFLFAGRTVAAKSVVLVSLEAGKLIVNCENITIGSMLMKDIKQAVSILI